MLTSDDCMKRYGEPAACRNMGVYITPDSLHEGNVPAKIYCNKDLIEPLHKALAALIEKGLISELHSWDGCFNIRNKRGSNTWSLHSWGVAIDVNAATNGFGNTPTLSAGFVKCFTDNGFDWGGVWHKPDGMHFQLIKLPK